MPLGAADVELATFQVDVTPPLGEGPCLGFMPLVQRIEHPLELRGLLIRAAGDVYIVAAVDYCGICNSSDATFRERLAQAAQTTSDRVALQSLHQHTAPVLDADAARLLYGAASERVAAHLEFTEAVTSRVAAEIRAARHRLIPVARIVGSRARVERFASNRRVRQPDGRILVRGSATSDPDLRRAAEGLIDPWVRTVTFFSREKPLAMLHYYATHPQSFYGDARISWDTVGIARQRLEDASGVFQIYFTGCGGNVAAGKYNDGTPEAREQLASRLYEAMHRSHAAALSASRADGGGGNGVPTSQPNNVHIDIVVDVAALGPDDVRWDVTELGFAPRTDGEVDPEILERNLADDRPFAVRLRAASFAAFGKRLRAGHTGAASRLRLGPIDLLHLPGEPFVELQLFAQETRPDGFVCVAGYGDCGVWYYGQDRMYTDPGGYEQTWSVTAPCEDAVKAALAALLKH